MRMYSHFCRMRVECWENIIELVSMVAGSRI
jgi:hypothetical protein